MSTPKHYRVDGELLVVAYPAFVILYWLNAPTLEGVKLVSEAIEPYEREGAIVDVVAVIPNTEDYPSDEARRQLAEGMRSPAIRRVALVAEGTGFRGSIVRSILSGISLMTRKKVPQKVLASVEEAEGWLLGHHSDFAFGELVGAYGRLRADVPLR